MDDSFTDDSQVRREFLKWIGEDVDEPGSDLYWHGWHAAYIRYSNEIKAVMWPEPAGVASLMPGTQGFTMVSFNAAVVPDQTRLYTEAQVHAMLTQ